MRPSRSTTPAFDLAAVVTDALGNTVCAGYDARGRKTAEWGTGRSPCSWAMTRPAAW